MLKDRAFPFLYLLNTYFLYSMLRAHPKRSLKNRGISPKRVFKQNAHSWQVLYNLQKLCKR